MKKIVILLISGLLGNFAVAQDILPDNLPQIVQDRLNLIELNYTADDQADAQSDDEVEYIYKGEKRDGSTDTIYCYWWNIHQEVWENHSRTINVYNGDEDITGSTFQYWTRDSIWVNGIQETYQYNMQDLLSERTVQVWCRLTNSWENRHHVVFTYNENHDPAGINFQKWNIQLTSWINHHRRLFVDDSLNALTADTAQIWHRTEHFWIPVTTHKYLYDSTGMLKFKITLKKCHFPGSPWHRIMKEEFFYNQDGLLANHLFQGWDQFEQRWFNIKRILSDYNENEKLITRVTQNWIRFPQIWMNDHQEQFFYGNEGLLNEVVKQLWNRVNSFWMNMSHMQFDYDASGNLIEKLLQHWHRGIADWVNVKKWIVAIQYKSDQAEQNIGKFEEEQIKVVIQNPYPAGTPVKVIGLGENTASVKLFDMNGRIMSSFTCRDQEEFYLGENIRAGVYLLNINNNVKTLYSTKLIIFE